MVVMATKRLDEWDGDDSQPATYEAIDQCIENVEYIATSLSETKSIGITNKFSLIEIEIPFLVNEDWLRQSSTYYAEIAVIYE